MGDTSSGVAKWSWEKSNGLATIEQTILAYQALSNKGKCKNFSYLVWNDIVSLVQNSLDALYLTWDNTLTTVDGALLSETDKVLTATKFNSVRKQLDRFNQYWYWETDSEQLGYVGRRDFVGRSDVGKKNADKLYGRYLIEITFALNNMINKLSSILEVYGYINLNPDVEAILVHTSSFLISNVYQFGIHIGLANLEFCEPYELAPVSHNINEIFNNDLVAEEPATINSIYTMLSSGNKTLDYDDVAVLTSNMEINLGSTLGIAMLVVSASISLLYQCNINPNAISNLEVLNIRKIEYVWNILAHEANLVQRSTVNMKYIENLLADIPTITVHPADHLIYSVDLYKTISLLAAVNSSNHETTLKMHVETTSADLNADRIAFARILHDINQKYVTECAVVESKRMELLKDVGINVDSVLSPGVPYPLASDYPVLFINKPILERGVPYPLFSLHNFHCNFVNDLQMGISFPLINSFNEKLSEHASLNYISPSDVNSYANLNPLSLVLLSLWYPPIYDDGRLFIRQSYYAHQDGGRLLIT